MIILRRSYLLTHLIIAVFILTLLLLALLLLPYPQNTFTNYFVSYDDEIVSGVQHKGMIQDGRVDDNNLIPTLEYSEERGIEEADNVSIIIYYDAIAQGLFSRSDSSRLLAASCGNPLVMERLLAIKRIS